MNKKNRSILFDFPAEDWSDAHLIGNGRMGAAVYGQLTKEKIELNDDSIWYGSPRNRINPEARNNLENVRNLIFNGHIKEAEKLLKYTFSATPFCERVYQPLGNFVLTHDWNEENSEISEYTRELDLNTAVVKLHAKVGERKIAKEYFASYPLGVILINIKVIDGPAFSCDGTLNRNRFYDNSGHEDQVIFMNGNLGEGGIKFAATASAVSDTGNVKAYGDHIVCDDAIDVTFVIASGTTFYEEEFLEAAKQKVTNAVDMIKTMGYEKVKENHIMDYKSLFDRVDFSLDDCSELDKKPINQRLELVREGKKDIGLVSLYFDYARYLMISGSRPGSQPLNLQGIWNNSMEPSWDSKYTININLEMNYWMTEMCNLSECHLPFFDLLKRVQKNGRITAKQMYGCDGFVAHHNVDLFGDTAPQDIYIPATYWVMGGAWMCTHLWKHYIFTDDTEWLKNEAYPIMKDAVCFFEDFLVLHEGVYVTCPSLSPENVYKNLVSGEIGHVCFAPAMDSEILNDLFGEFIKASQILGVNDDIVKQAVIIKDNLPPLKIGSDGRLLEWNDEYEEMEPGHRHISHLYGLYPSNQITFEKTPQLFDAAKKTLKKRLDNGGGYTGWSCAWIINFYAALMDGEGAYDNIIKLLSKSTYNNMCDNHPTKMGSVFQIDGNLGACAGIVNMLVQSDENGEIKLLPALPKEWPCGHIYGIKLPHGKTIDISWKDGKIEKYEIKD